VCESRSSILSNGGGKLDADRLRNIGDGGRQVGSSQVTAVVEQCRANGSNARYEITARAAVVTPYAGTLTLPRELSPAECNLFTGAGNDGKRCHDWLAVAKQLRRI
jgi:hypothetical protein